MSDYFEVLEERLAELTAQGAHLDRSTALPRMAGRRWWQGILPAASVAVAIGVAAIVLGSVHGRVRTPVRHVATSRGPSSVGGPLVHELAVFRRPQTARDRTLPTLLRRAERLGHTERGQPYPYLEGAIPSLTRYAETISGDREVFLVVYREAPSPGPPSEPRFVPAPTTTLLGVFIVQPDGKWTYGQPIMTGLGGEPAGGLWLNVGSASACVMTTHWAVVPDRVARVRWQFARQDDQGYDYGKPLALDLPARGNVVAATVGGRPSCEQADAVTVYDARGRVISHRGNPAALDRITRPIHPGKPPLITPGLTGP